MTISKHRLTEELKAEASALGFELSGVCPAVAPDTLSDFVRWIDAGYGGQMHYLHDRSDAYGHPRSILSGVRSLLLLGRNYLTDDAEPVPAGNGRISRYAWGLDYHEQIHKDLKKLSGFLQAKVPTATVRGVVDTAPLLEREFARLAGLGWIGKNTLLINRQAGSWFFLAALLTDLELDYDQTHETDHCGTCTACLDACPTDAFVEPYVLDSRKCISYLTIELREAVPDSLREGIGDWVFGCDVCQDVCPWNQRVAATPEQVFSPRPQSNPLPLVELFDLDEEQFRARFRQTPLWRARRRGLLRNAAINLGNRPTAAGEKALAKGLTDEEPLVRGAAAWALGRHGSTTAAALLAAQLDQEQDAEVRAEIDGALAHHARSTTGR